METRSLHKVSELLDILEQTPGEPGNLSTMLQHIVHTAYTFFSADDCMIFAINPITEEFIESLAVESNVLKTSLACSRREQQVLTRLVLERGILAIADTTEPTVASENVGICMKDMRSLVGLTLSTRYLHRPLGVVILRFKEPQCFDCDEHELFQLFADRSSYILQETWLLRRYQEVANIGREINQQLDTVEVLFQELQQHTSNILDTSHTLVLAVCHPQTNTLDMYMLEEGTLTIRYQQPPRGAMKYVIDTQRELFIRQLSEVMRDLPAHLMPGGGSQLRESFIYMPLVLRGISLGALSIQHPEPDAYSEGDLFIMSLLANHIAVALHNIRLYESMSHLNESGQVLTQQIDSDQVLQRTVDHIREKTYAGSVILYLYDSALQRFVLPPRVSGQLRDPIILTSTFLRPLDIPVLALRYQEPIFAAHNAELYTILRGNGFTSVEANFQQREHIESVAVLSLQVGEVSLGVLFINFSQLQQFDEPQKLLITGLAHYAAIAIKNARDFGSLAQRRIRELEDLQQIDRALSLPLELDTVLDTILHLGHQHVPAEEATILLYNAQTAVLEPRAAIGPNWIASLKQSVSSETKGITRWVLERKKPVRVSNVHRDLPWRDLHLPVGGGTVSELDVPMMDGDEVVGVLNFESTREDAFGYGEELFLVTLAGQAVLAIKKARDFEREKRLADEAKVLNDISKEIVSQLDSTSVFDLILDKALELTHSTLGSLHLYITATNTLWMVSERGVAADKKSLRQRHYGQGVVGHVAKDKRTVNIGDISRPPWDNIYMTLFSGVRSELAVPMLERGNLRGVLNVESPDLHNFNDSDVRLLEGLADLAVVALQNAERYKKAEQAALAFELLYEAGQELDKLIDIEEIARAYMIIFSIAERYSQCQVILRRYDDDTQELVLVAASPHQQYFPQDRVRLDEGPHAHVARERKTKTITDPFALTFDARSRTYGPPGSTAITPIQFEDRYYGDMELNHEEFSHFDKNDIHFLEELSDQLAATIHRLEETRTRQELEQMSSIGHSAFEVTHRLGNDLGLISFYVGDIQAELEALEVKNTLIAEKLDQILQSVTSVLSFSNNLKQQVAKMGHEDEAMGESIDLYPEPLLREVIAQLNFSASAPLVEILLDVHENVTAVRAVEGQVTAILHNLIDNAIHAMPRGGKLTLKARNVGRFVSFEVIDTGIGIAPKLQEKVFGLFFSTKRSSGFGLWSARRNALRNHGDLKVRSQPGKGTTFTLLLPRADGGTL